MLIVWQRSLKSLFDPPGPVLFSIWNRNNRHCCHLRRQQSHWSLYRINVSWPMKASFVWMCRESEAERWSSPWTLIRLLWFAFSSCGLKFGWFRLEHWLCWTSLIVNPSEETLLNVPLLTKVSISRKMAVHRSQSSVRPQQLCWISAYNIRGCCF